MGGGGRRTSSKTQQCATHTRTLVNAMKARSGYQARAVRRTRRVVTLGSTLGHVAPRHAAQGCAGGRAGAALPTLTQAVPGHEHAEHRLHREHDESRQDAARRMGPCRATCAPRRGQAALGHRAAASCTWARLSQAASGHVETAPDQGARGEVGARHAMATPGRGRTTPSARGHAECRAGSRAAPRPRRAGGTRGGRATTLWPHRATAVRTSSQDRAAPGGGAGAAPCQGAGGTPRGRGAPSQGGHGRASREHGEEGGRGRKRQGGSPWRTRRRGQTASRQGRFRAARVTWEREREANRAGKREERASG
jgi:hypothetical protein